MQARDAGQEPNRRQGKLSPAGTRQNATGARAAEVENHYEKFRNVAANTHGRMHAAAVTKSDACHIWVICRLIPLTGLAKTATQQPFTSLYRHDH